jgi:hypothetical protein
MEPSALSRNAFAKGKRRRRSILLLLCGFWLWGNAPFLAISVEDAYRAIPHRYTPFESKSVKMSPRDAVFLQEFFRLLNLAIVERVQMQAWFQSSGKKGSAFPNYQRTTDGLIAQLVALTVPEGLKTVHRSVLEALKEQRAYFEEWQRAVTRREPFKYALGASPHHPRILSASQKLHEAYGRLMQAYPQEAGRTKQAFFDHLCALDFI